MASLTPDQAKQLLEKDPQKVIQMMGNEILRLRKLLEKNGINPNLVSGNHASLSVSATVKIVDSEESKQI